MGISKQLMPIYDKPMIYYPISTLLGAGINDILIITTPHDNEGFVRLLGDGSRYGCSFTYAVQEEPRGLADAFIIGEEFIGNDKVALILGDNLFHGSDFGNELKKCTDPDGGIVFAYQVADPERYGVVDFDDNMTVLSVEEKPTNPKSDYALVGLYFFDNDVPEIAKSIKPSARGEIEITEVMDAYLKQKKLQVRIMDRGSVWLDTGTIDSMVDAADYIRVVQNRTGLNIGSVEEIAWRQGFINDDQLRKLAEPLAKSGYGKYLYDLLK